MENKVTVRGLVNESETGKDVFYSVWNRWYNGKLSDHTYNNVLNSFADDDFKETDEDLQKLVGVYPIEINDEPMWKDDFVSMVICFLDEVGYKQINDHIGNYDFELKEEMKENIPLMYGSTKKYWQVKDELANILYNSKDVEISFREGMITVGKRKTKLLKYIRDFIKKMIVISDAEFEKLDWYKFYVKHKETKQQLYLVITNSIASSIGMSSYAPYKGTEDEESTSKRDRVWSSCQCHYHNHNGYSRASWANLMDKGSLIAYVTDGNLVPFYGWGKEKMFMHPQMICRWTLRMLQHRFTAHCNNCNRDVIVKHKNGVKCKQCEAPLHPDNNSFSILLDRAYPNDMYSKSVFNKILELCNSLDYSMSMFHGYNSSQNSNNFSTSKYLKGLNTQYGYSAYKIPIVYVTDVESREKFGECGNCDSCVRRCCNDCTPFNTNVCEGCDLDQQYHCNRCGNFCSDCVGRSCEECEESPCYDPNYYDEDDEQQSEYTHYDDQTGGCSTESDVYTDDDDKYYYEYDIYEPLNWDRELEKLEDLPVKFIERQAMQEIAVTKLQFISCYNSHIETKFHSVELPYRFKQSELLYLREDAEVNNFYEQLINTLPKEKIESINQIVMESRMYKDKITNDTITMGFLRWLRDTLSYYPKYGPHIEYHDRIQSLYNKAHADYVYSPEEVDLVKKVYNYVMKG